MIETVRDCLLFLMLYESELPSLHKTWSQMLSYAPKVEEGLLLLNILDLLETEEKICSAIDVSDGHGKSRVSRNGQN